MKRVRAFKNSINAVEKKNIRLNDRIYSYVHTIIKNITYYLKWSDHIFV
jgi:hypothetical protein